MIYHITTQTEWEQAKKIGEYIPLAFSVDGFIHCSDPIKSKIPPTAFMLPPLV
jgi:uncharacterized protein (DUF952 family)